MQLNDHRPRAAGLRFVERRLLLQFRPAELLKGRVRKDVFTPWHIATAATAMGASVGELSMPVLPFTAFSTMRSRFKSMSAPASSDHHPENISLVAGSRPTTRWEVTSQSIRP
jgi:hypothetical protein